MSVRPRLVELLRDGRRKDNDAQASIETVGDLADFTASRRLTDIKGIGEKAAEEITAILDKFWADNPQPAPEPAAVPAMPDLPHLDSLSLAEVDLKAEDFEGAYCGDTLGSSPPKGKAKEHTAGKAKKILRIAAKPYCVFAEAHGLDGLMTASMHRLYAREEWGNQPCGIGHDFDVAATGGAIIDTPAGELIIGPASENIRVRVKEPMATPAVPTDTAGMRDRLLAIEKEVDNWPNVEDVDPAEREKLDKREQEIWEERQAVQNALDAIMDRDATVALLVDDNDGSPPWFRIRAFEYSDGKWTSDFRVKLSDDIDITDTWGPVSRPSKTEAVLDCLDDIDVQLDGQLKSKGGKKRASVINALRQRVAEETAALKATTEAAA
jgi:hypothetical protein